MKKYNLKTLLSTLSVLTLIIATSTFLYGNNYVRIYPIEGSKKAKVYISVPEKADVNLSIQNTEGQRLYSETISDRPVYSRIYDFTNLENGLYSMVTTTGCIVESNEFEVKGSDIKLLKSATEYKPLFLLNSKLLMINFLNREADKIKVTMEDNNGTFFTDTNSGNLTFEKAYDINSLPAGYYYVSLYAGDKSYFYNFEVD